MTAEKAPEQFEEVQVDEMVSNFNKRLQMAGEAQPQS
jgi:hypothetical protein